MSTPDTTGNERRAQISSMKEAGRAALAGQTVAQRNRTRGARATEWTQWLRKEMDSHGCEDPVEVLPAALARIEQIIDDRTLSAIRQLKSELRKALAK
jgi:hypothetical protein